MTKTFQSGRFTMKSAALVEIENRLPRLSEEEKRLLIRELAQQLTSRDSALSFETHLAAMAADPDIQREIEAINREFSGTEMDGLENL
jgi:hypothetical protein